MSVEIGRRAGGLLAAFGEGLRLAEAVATADLAQAAAERRHARETAAHQLQEAAAERGSADVLVSQLAAIADHLQRSRLQTPQDHSTVRGTFYLVLAMLLVFADVSIVGQVIVLFLPGFQMIDAESERSFIDILFTRPLEAYAKFPGLLLLCLAILMIGFFAKPFLDGLASWMRSDSKARREELPRLLLYGLAMALSGLTLLAMAGARLALEWGDKDNLSANIVMAILGLSLPLVSAAFFVKGFECWASWWRVVWASWKARWAARRARRLAAVEGEARARLARLFAEEEAVTGAPQQASYVAQRRLQFAQGYREGLAETLNDRSGGLSLFDKLRPVLLEEARRRSRV